MDWRDKTSNDKNKKDPRTKERSDYKPDTCFWNFKAQNKKKPIHFQQSTNEVYQTNINNFPDQLKQNLTKNKFEKNEIKNNFGFKSLENLSYKDSSEIIFVISNKSNGFMDLFSQDKDPKWIFLLMKVSAKVCSTELIQSKILLLSELTCNKFITNLKIYILSIPTESNVHLCEKMNFFLKDCLVVFKSITTLFPKTAVERLIDVVISFDVALNSINKYSSKYCNNIRIDETTIDEIDKILKKLNDIKNSFELKKETKVNLIDMSQFLPPPENFRELSVYPTTIDLEFEKPFLRPNILKGAYQNVEHYLDVQFRLLREDFIAPLREGINSYKEMINSLEKHQYIKKIDNIRVYCNVEMQSNIFVHDKLGVLINFNKSNKLKINWEMSKRFIYGSLLVFTENNFKSFILGVVLERDIKHLKAGQLVIELLEDAKPIYNINLTMIESEVFFEPYKCTMEVLKKINSHNFPMKKYIVSACNIIDIPNYINKLKVNYSIEGLHSFNILENDKWPNKEQFGIDESQYNAFKAALTNEFTVIQGPPGTGKTFIGLKIIKTIIQNVYPTFEYEHSNCSKFLTQPILVVCYTNHALDQFIEGILHFTNNVVRIGGQSKSEMVNKFNLMNITRNYRKSYAVNTSMYQVRNQVRNIMNDIKYLKACSKIVSYNTGILELSLLKNGMPEKYHNFFKTSLDLLSWLFQDFTYFKLNPIIFLNSINIYLNNVLHSKNMLQISVDNDDNNDELRYKTDDPDLEFSNEEFKIYCLTIDSVEKAKKKHQMESERLSVLAESNILLYNEAEEEKFIYKMMKKIHNYFSKMLRLVDVNIHLPKIVHNLSMLNMEQRWAIYFCWMKTTKDMFGPKIDNLENRYTQYHKQYLELKEMENIEILSKKHVVALTTCGAAKHRIMLGGLKSPIVVVEEAAEVLESHVISSLTKHCQHLILIGDHKQLRPSNAVYKLAKDFKFDISLFERMVNNGVPCYTLDEQHRMRPEIALLITPTIYPQLKNHISVNNRKHIRGVTKDLFFLNHNLYENEIEEISSKSNEHEATFLIMFARHLLLQGYKPDQVTILTTYSGQMYFLRNLQKQYTILKEVKIIIVDNYQGEESDIILLSLVRNNEKGNVGFLKTENRICVALSRAKYGLYIMGNMDSLYNSGNLWKKIKKTLIEQDSYGDELILECAIHSGVTTNVSKSSDFNLIMEGGCTMLCKSLLLCGHYCTSICHSYDCEHLVMQCKEPCNRSCNYNHPCKKICFIDCGNCTVLLTKDLSCGHQKTLPCFVDPVTYLCEEIVEVVLKECGHKIMKKCHEKNPNCTFKCFDRLDCGHSCERNCHKNDDPDHEKYNCLKPCEQINKKCSLNHMCQKLCHENCSFCSVKIDKTLLCGHTKNSVPCGFDEEQIKCMSPCERILMCNHKCQAMCYEKCPPCNEQVEKITPDCGHSVVIKCSINPKRKNCIVQNCEKMLICGHKCKNICAVECTTENCNELISINTNTINKLSCGHDKVWVLCRDRDTDFEMDSLLDKCQEPCLQQLSCNDICSGTCGECKQGRLHMPCKETCNKINPCNHTCKSPCKELCPPCNLKCQYSCVHSKCNHICGTACIQCMERCNWKCSHLTCTKKCHEICDRKPCYEPCELKLQCGHMCVGFCGEPCPPLCRICQHDEITTIIFGNEDEANARFVYLEDCKHIIESQALERWIALTNKEIAMKLCPLCKTPILKTQRFMNQVKIVLKDISIIKKKQYGEQIIIKSKKNKTINSLQTLDNKFDSFFIGDINKFIYIKDLWTNFSKPLLASLNFKQNKQANYSLPTKDIESLEYVINLFKSISKYKEQIKHINDIEMKKTVINHFVWLLSVAFKHARQLSNQQKIDINMEFARGIRLVFMYEINSSFKFKAMIKSTLKKSDEVEVINLIHDMRELLTSPGRYSLAIDENIQTLIEYIKPKIDAIELITDEERKMIHQAMSVNFHGGIKAQGHWCKCSNGHIYCITECGGPMQETVCPECKIVIGGQRHRYVDGVTVASEMDGANHLAWTSANNMRNYVLE